MLAAPVVFGLAMMLVVVPQVLSNGSLLKLGLIGAHAGSSPILWRYATNLSECGPVRMVFSPLIGDMRELAFADAPTVAIRLGATASHVITGWDARPSPTYIHSLDDDRWALVTAMSGFVLVAVAAAAWLLWRRRRSLFADPDIAFVGVAMALVVAGQVVLATSAAEFRFNLLGWLVGGTLLVMLVGRGGWTRRHVGLFIGASVLVSSAVLILGQMTLELSPTWVACSV
jgi:hypothetical protein